MIPDSKAITVKEPVVATGSEVALACEISHKLATENRYSKVISMPCHEIFDNQNKEYKNKILNETKFKISIEAGSTYGWDKWANVTIGIDSFGTSAPGDVALTEFGITSETIQVAAKNLLKNKENI